MAAFSIIGREGSVPVHVWAKTLDDKSREQLLNTASLPFVFHHVAAMPDVHAGLGATIGSVIATEGASSRAPSASTSAAACALHDSTSGAVTLTTARSALSTRQFCGTCPSA